MTKPNFIFKVAAVFVFCLLSSSVSFAQSDAKSLIEPSYEVILQVIVGSSAAQKNNLPAALSTVTKNLRNNFSFSNYDLSDTYIGRVSNTGSVEYKALSGNFGQPQSSQSPVFLDWSLGISRNSPNGKGQNTIQIQPFRFGARLPVIAGSGVINYESIGLTSGKVSLPENVPTLIGTLPAPKNGETLFLILTVKSVE